MTELVIATRNKKKLHELERYLRPLGIKVLTVDMVAGAPVVREDGKTFRANAGKKARAISRLTGGLVLADDSGLVVDALGGAPGIRSARFAGRGANDGKNNALLLRLLKGVPPSKRTARFVCAVAIADSGRVIETIEESCSGVIGGEARGRHGFGYDPLFLIPKYGKSFGELGLKVKDKMSHRSKALRKARAFLRKYIGMKRRV